MATILTVDDSPSLRKMVAHVLSDAGHQVTEGVDGSDGLQKAEASQFDLILSDINMPNMDGISFVSAVRKMPNYRFTPILILTTESTQEKKSEGRNAGATGWLVKPFDPDKLLAAVSKVLGRSSHAG